MADPVNKWNQPESAPPPMFFGKKERDLVKQVNDELAERVIGQTIAYYAVSLEDSEYHPIYGEAIDKVTLEPVRVFAYVTVENEQTNERYGYDYQTKLTVNFHRKRVTEDQNLFVRVGDFVQYGDEFYEIARTYNDTRYYFGQIEHKFQISAECIKARKGTFRIRGEMKPQIVTPAPGAAVPALPIPSPPPAVPRAPNNAQYVVLEADDNLTKERVLTAGSNIILTDAGAGGTLTIDSSGGGSPSGSTVVYSGTGVRTSGYLRVTGSTTLVGALSSSAGAGFAGSVSSSGDLAITGALHAATLYGDGSGLTNLSADGIDVTSSTGDLSYRVVFTEDFQSDGSLGLGGNTGLVYNPTDAVLSSSAGTQIVGDSIFGGALSVTGNTILGATASVGTTSPLGQLHVSGAHKETMFRVDGAPSGTGNTGTWLLLTGSRGSDGNPVASLGIGTDDPQQALDVNGYVTIGRTGGAYILINDDPDTWIRFGHAGADSMQFQAGGLNFLEFDENGLDIARINADGVDIDFQVLTLGNDYTIFAEGSTDRVGIGTQTPSHTLTVAGGLSGSGVLQAVGATTLTNTLDVTGAVTFAATASLSSVNMTGSLSGSHTAVFGSSISSSGDLAVTGNVHAEEGYFAGDVTIDGTLIGGSPLRVSGAINIVDNVGNILSTFSTGGLSGSTFLEVVGASTLGGTLSVSGSTVFADSLSSSAGARFVGSISSSGDLAVTGNAHAASYYGDGSNLTGIAGSASGSARHYSTTGFETSGYLKVTGSTTLAGTGSVSSLVATGSISGSSTLEAAGATILGSTLSVSGNVLVSSNITASGDIVLDEDQRIYFEADKGTWIESDGTDRLRFAVGGNQMLLLDQDDKRVNIGYAMKLGVGLGNNTTPSALMQVSAVSADDDTATLFRVDGATAGNVLFVTGTAPAGRVGIGTDDPDYALDVAGTVGIDSYIYHNGDADTYLLFQADEVNLVAGGKSVIRLDESGTNDKIQINNTNADIDLQVMADDGEVVLHTDAGTNRVGINTITPGVALEVVGAMSASSTLQAVGAATLGSTLAVSGAATLGATGSFSSVVATGSISGSSTLQAVGAVILGSTLNVTGATTLAATASVSSIVATGSISGSSTFQAVGATILGSTLNVSGAVTVEGSVSSSGQVYAGDITLAPNAGNATPQILFTSPGGGAEIASTGAGTFNLVSNAVLELRAGASSDLQLGAGNRTGDVVLGSSGQLSSSYGAVFVQSVSSSGDVAVTGNVHAAAYYGDGSNLTGVDAVSGSSRHYSSTGLETSGYLKVTGSTTLAGTGSVSSLVATGSISGSSTLEAGGATILGSTLAVSGAATLGATGSFSSVNMTGSLSGSHTAVFGSSISSSSDIAVSGNAHATTYYGDGSNLTGIGASTASGSARHYSATGLETSGYLKVSGSTTMVGTGSVSSIVATGSISGSSTLEAGGATILGSTLAVSGAATLAATGSFSSVNMTGSLSGSHTAVFGSSISSSGDVAVTGNVHAAAYYGDGSNLTGVDAASGSSRHYSSTGLETSGYLKVTGSTTLAGTGSFSVVNMTGSLSGSHTAVFGSSISSSGDAALTGNVHAAAFFGDGAGLTNISADGIDVTSSTGDLAYKMVFTEGFQTDGTLGLGGNTGLIYNPNDAVLSSSAGAQLVGASIFGGTVGVSGATTLAATASVSSVVATGSISGSSTLQAVGAVTLGDALSVSGSSTFGGGITYPRSAITAATYTVLVTDYYIGVDPTSNAVTLTLPVAATAGTGKTYVIKDETGQAAANAITIDPDGTETVDGVASFDINSPYGAAHFYTDGSNWFIY